MGNQQAVVRVVRKEHDGIPNACEFLGCLENALEDFVEIQR
jgi:hypothetical protein